MRYWRLNSELVISAGRVLVLFATSFLLLKVRGAGLDTDAYLLTTNIFGSLGNIFLMTCDQFLYHYSGSKRRAHFLGGSLWMLWIVGLVLSGALILLRAPLGQLYMRDAKPELLAAVCGGFWVPGVITFFFQPLNQVLMKSLDFHGRASFSFSTTMLPNLGLLGALLIGGNLWPGSWLMGATALGVFIQFLVLVYSLARDGHLSLYSTETAGLAGLVNDSMRKKGASNLHNFLLGPVTTNILALAPLGSATVFYTAQRVLNSARSIALGAGYNQFFGKMVRGLSEGSSFSSIMREMKAFGRSSLLTYLLLAGAGIVGLPLALLLMKVQVSAYAVVGAALSLLLWDIVLVWQARWSPLILGLLGFKDLVAVNSVFLILFSALAFLLVGKIGVLAIGTSAAVAQLSSVLLFRARVLKAWNPERSPKAAQAPVS